MLEDGRGITGQELKDAKRNECLGAEPMLEIAVRLQSGSDR